MIKILIYNVISLYGIEKYVTGCDENSFEILNSYVDNRMY